MFLENVKLADKFLPKIRKAGFMLPKAGCVLTASLFYVISPARGEAASCVLLQRIGKGASLSDMPFYRKERSLERRQTLWQHKEEG